MSQIGDQAMNIARQAVLAAGFDETVPATTIDRQCGSSQQAAHFAAQGVPEERIEAEIRRFASGALYGFPENLLMEGVKPFHPLDVLDSALTAWREKAFQLNTWTV